VADVEGQRVWNAKIDITTLYTLLLFALQKLYYSIKLPVLTAFSRDLSTPSNPGLISWLSIS
jgi:hypothetical protein